MQLTTESYLCVLSYWEEEGEGTINIRWINGTVSGLVSLFAIALAWWLGWQGVKPSWQGLLVVAGAIGMLGFEYLAWRLAHNNHNVGAVVTANAVSAILVIVLLFLAPVIGWGAAIATITLMFIWATSTLAAAIGGRNGERNEEENVPAPPPAPIPTTV